MEEIKLCLNKDLKYVVACSFGPDSMALLNLAIEEKLNIVVAHVNYHKREASQFEQDSLSIFCKERKIPFFVLDLLGEKPTENFQDWARKKRYEFFKIVAEKTGSNAILVAHQQDDLIETYLMQKERRNFVKNLGIAYENELFGIKVIRPLLPYSKKQLQQYDNEKGIPFSIDESNLTDHYVRNKIRHSIVEKLSKPEREQILQEIKNNEKVTRTTKTIFKKEEFLALTYEEIILFFDFYMTKVNEHRDLSRKFISEIKTAFEHKTTLRIKITKKLWLELDYNNVYLVNASKIHSYNLKANKKTTNDFIEVDFSSGAEDRGISYLPPTFIVKNCEKSDVIKINDYNSTIRRLFIDWKMPLFLREVWPGIYDETNKLLYVPRYREQYIDNHKSIFKINTKYFTEF